MYCCHRSKENLLIEGETFMIVDAGGGTVDLVRKLHLFGNPCWEYLWFIHDLQFATIAIDYPRGRL